MLEAAIAITAAVINVRRLLLQLVQYARTPILSCLNRIIVESKDTMEWTRVDINHRATRTVPLILLILPEGHVNTRHYRESPPFVSGRIHTMPSKLPD